jgi:exopolyphosphatase/guanosine-5'-triphosphate,3'-diphosphate pyrophosphatase
MDRLEVSAHRAVATSAVREASNSGLLVERARRDAGIELETIEGVEEARLVHLAVSRKIPLRGRVLLVDVGGGSTELFVVDKGRPSFSISLPLGTVRLLDALPRAMPQAIDRVLAEALPRIERVDAMIGTGGNIDTLAELCAGERGVADVKTMRALLRRMSAMSPAERTRTFALRADRADTIVPAAAIFTHLADKLRIAAVRAPGVGVKDGILAELIDRHFKVWDAAGHDERVLDACRRLGRRYQWDEAHAERVARFAACLFDDLAPLHPYGRRERLLLSAGALLHDVGDFVRYDAHHKHSQYIIENSDIMGLGPVERRVVANLARYHRKGAPSMAHASFAALDKAERAKVRVLSAILRVADALDREHRGKVRRVRAILRDGEIGLRIDGAPARDLEEWSVLAKAGPLREVFGRELVLVKKRRAAEKTLAA